MEEMYRRVPVVVETTEADAFLTREDVFLLPLLLEMIPMREHWLIIFTTLVCMYVCMYVSMK